MREKKMVSNLFPLSGNIGWQLPYYVWCMVASSTTKKKKHREKEGDIETITELWENKWK